MNNEKLAELEESAIMRADQMLNAWALDGCADSLAAFAQASAILALAAGQLLDRRLGR